MTPEAAETPRRQRILFLNNQGLASIGGGVTILRRIVTDLMRDHDVAVLSYDPPAAGFVGVRQIVVPAPSPPGRFWRLAPLLRARHLKTAVPAATLASADLVIVLDCHFAPLLRRMRLPRVIYLSLSCIPRQEWFAGGGPARLLGVLQYAWLERSAVRCAHGVVVSSNRHATELRRFEALPNLRPHVLHPVFPRDDTATGGAPAGVPVILSAGRLEPVKNYAAVIDIAAHLRDLPCRFVIAGDGPLLANLRTRAATANLADKVTFLGTVSDMTPLLSQASLFLHPSRYESFGIAVLEAMRAGVPPVVPIGTPAGYHEILTAGTDSCHVDPHDPADAAAAIRRLLTDPDRRAAMGAAARKTAGRVVAQDYVASFRAIATRLLQRVPEAA